MGRGKKRRSTRSHRRRRQRQIQIIFFGTITLALVVLFILLVKKYSKQAITTLTEDEASVYEIDDRRAEGLETFVDKKVIAVRPELDVQLLILNEYSRPGTPVTEINSIIIHYTANPGTTAQENRDYFEGLAETGEESVSSNFVIGLEGEIIQCIPSSEIAYASNGRNSDSLSIEVCHWDETGEFTNATYDSLVEFVAWLCGEFDVEYDEILRHYDVTGKECPLYYVEHEDEWIQFKEDVADYIETYGVWKSELLDVTE